MASPERVQTDGAAPVAERTASGGRGLGLPCLVVGVLAGLIAWGVEEINLSYFAPTYQLSKEQRASTPVAGAEMIRQRLSATTRTAMISCGSLAGLLGLGLGLVGGRAVGSWRKGATAGVVGLAVGAAGGALLSRVLVPKYYNEMSEADDLTLPLLLHLGMWASAGIAGGLGLGIGLGSRNRGVAATIGGVIGVALGVAACEFAGAMVFPLAETNLPIAAGLWARLMVALGVAVFGAVGAAVAAGSLGEAGGMHGRA